MVFKAENEVKELGEVARRTDRNHELVPGSYRAWQEKERLTTGLEL